MNRNLIRSLYAALLIALSLAALVHIRPAYAAGYVVNTLADNTTDDGACTLREAILAANNAPANDDCGAGSSGNDTITFGVNGTITLTSTLPTIVSGQGALTIDGTGQSITISGNNSVQVMVVNGGANLTLRNLTVAQGRASGFPGGGVYNYNNGTLTVTNSTFSGNSAYYGGGIYNYGTVSVTNSTFSSNNSLYGGGIFNEGTLTVTNSTFSGNSADYGGGIYSYTSGTLTVTNSTFSGNSANNYGGGINNNGSGTLTVTGSTFSGNSAGSGGGGGGIYNVTSGTLTVTNSTFSGNSATHFDGGGILNGGTLTVTNSTFSGNSANTGGGGILTFGTLTVTNSTFSGNSANTGGGIRNDGGTATLKNTLIANSPSGGDCVGSLSVGSINNLIESIGSNACGLTNGVNGNIIGYDPSLGTLTGSPAYFPLNAGSPAIDAGDNATCAAAPVNNQSQNGVIRPLDGDGNGTAICDIGSYEKGSRLYLPLILR
jgi:CSLREA domain-containing protein